MLEDNFRVDEKESRVYVAKLDGVSYKRFMNSIDYLISKGTRSIDLDLSQAAELTGSGIGVLIETYSKLEQKGIALSLLNPNSHAQDIIEKCSLNHVMAIKYERQEDQVCPTAQH